MKSYKYLSATYGWGWVTVESIDSTVLDWILAKLQEFLPGCAVKDREELPLWRNVSC